MFSLAGRVALVTGGNGGLGRVIAAGLRAAGASVVLTGRDRARNASAAREFGSENVFEVDVRDEDTVDRVVGEVLERHGALDVLVNNAGMIQGSGALRMSRGDWETTLATNLGGAFACARSAARAMIAGGRGGKIINIASVYAEVGTPAVELAEHNILVNAILPGFYETEAAAGNVSTDRRKQVIARTPVGRWGRPEELVGPVVFLASGASSYVTGASLVVDGGFLVSPR
jgi:NAD(P)-dependent dehydrogenase (short-subunit alcohol dehydrogenase family)